MIDKKLVKLIKESLTPDLLENKFWRDRQKERPMAGFCYIASESYYHLKGKYGPYHPHYVRVLEGKIDMGHWFLKSEDGKILDITASQFNRIPEYALSKRRAFLTKNPSRRAKIVMDRVKEKCKADWKTKNLGNEVIHEKRRSISSLGTKRTNQGRHAVRKSANMVRRTHSVD